MLLQKFVFFKVEDLSAQDMKSFIKMCIYKQWELCFPYYQKHNFEKEAVMKSQH